MTLGYESTKAIQIDIKENKKIIDIHDIAFANIGNSNIFAKISKAKDIGRMLKKHNQTIVICHKGKTVLKFGEEANPKLALFITRSKDIEVTDLFELRRMSKIV